MRKYHRWLSVLFGIFLLWIAVTGVMSQIVPLVQRGGFEEHDEGGRMEKLAPQVPPGFVCPESMICRPRPKDAEARALVSFLHHLHSGESFGPLGTVISLLSGLAMIFFAFSGLWLYIQMWRSRKGLGLSPRWWWS